jgi:hypothetical protein
VDKTRRIRRENPERCGPVRSFSKLFAESSVVHDNAGSSNGFHTSEEPSGAGRDPIAEGVKRAYQVIDEYIAQGRRAAEQFVGKTGFSAAPSPANLQVLFEQMMRRQTELLPLWLELLGALTSSERPFVSPSKPGEATLQGTAKVAIEISSRQLAQVDLDLRSNSPFAELTIPGLHSVDGEHQPIREIAFESTLARHVIRIRVPDDQPSGTYAGVIVNRKSGHACGSLTVRVRSD